MKSILLSLSLLTLLSCDNKKQTTPKVSPPRTNTATQANPPEKPQQQKSSLVIRGDLGTIDRAMVQKKFEASREILDSCIYKGVGQDAFVGGQMNFTFRINLDGTVKRLDYSADVGSWAVEECVYLFAKKLTFIKPKGGEAKVSYSYGFVASMEVKKRWGDREVSSALRRVKRRLLRCSDGTDQAPSEYRLVFYVLPDGELGQLGLSSGRRLPSKKFYSCVHRALKRAKFKDPMGTVAKVDIRIAP